MEEEKCAADELLSAIQKTSKYKESIPSDLLALEMSAHCYLGNNATVCNDPVDAIKHYRRAGHCIRALGGHDEGTQMLQIQMKIAQEQCALQGEDAAATNATLLPLSRVTFEKLKENYGEDSEITLENGCSLVSILCELKQVNEAKQLLAKLRSNALRVFGAHHHLTQQIEVLGVQVLLFGLCI